MSEPGESMRDVIRFTVCHYPVAGNMLFIDGIPGDDFNVNNCIYLAIPVGMSHFGDGVYGGTVPIDRIDEIIIFLQKFKESALTE